MTRTAPYDRETALDAALELFWRKGYHATSLKDLEAALQMKPGSIYAAFKSKEALYLLCLDRYYEAFLRTIHGKVARSEHVLSGLAAFLRDLGRPDASAQARRTCLIARTIVESPDETAAIGASGRDYYLKIRGEFADLFQAAKQREELPPDADVDLLAQRYQSHVTALRVEAHLGLAQPALTRMADDLARQVETCGASDHG